MAERPTYVPFFEDMFRAIECLTDEQLRQFMDALHAYAFEGVEPTCDGPAQVMFLGFRASLDKSLARLRANRANGRRRARQKPADAEPEPTSLPPVGESVASAEPDAAGPKPTDTRRAPSDGEPDPHGTDAEPTGGQRPPKEKPTTSETQASSNPAASETQAKTDKTKDRRPKTEDQEEKSVSARVRAPRPLTKFTPPTLEEVREYGDAYCQENQIDPSTFDAARFVDHFTSNGWKVSGRAPMRDWKASVRNWIRNDHPELGRGQANGWADKYTPTAVTLLD